jgi:SAM-dependent methyltransferase
MAISALMLHWFTRLKRKEIWGNGASMLELGPQDILTTEPVLRGVLNGFFGSKDGERTANKMFGECGLLPNAQIHLYRALGVSSYASLDLLDPRSRYRFDLNEPVDMVDRFDIVTNFGTSEHVFNIGMSFRNADFLTAPGGLLLFVLPAFGHINHGFYNIHPTLYFDFAKANGYEVEDILYIDNFGVRCRMAEKTPEQAPNLDELPIKLTEDLPVAELERQVAEQFADNVSAAETRAHMHEFPMICFDYVFAALRRHRDGSVPFTPPTQGLYQG